MSPRSRSGSPFRQTEPPTNQTIYKIEKPKKSDYRQRAHVNPLSDTSAIAYPITPYHIDWSMFYPMLFPGHGNPNDIYLNTATYKISFPDEPVGAQFRAFPDFLDIGCGFGGLTVSLAKTFPEERILALEIREKVTNYVGERIRALRAQAAIEKQRLIEAGDVVGAAGVVQYDHIAVLRSNAMKSLVNFIPKASCEKLFFCFPDPHFKKNNWRRRIVNDSLISTWAYVMKPGSKLYFVTDVIELFDWMDGVLSRADALFERVADANEDNDPCVRTICNDTEEGMKVKRGGHPCYFSVFRKKQL